MIDMLVDFLVLGLKIIGVLVAIGTVFLFIYDRYVQRRHQLLINYPVIGRMRYVFEALREPLRQYFASETFYESRDKIDWVYKAAKNLPNFMSFSVAQPFNGSRFMLKHAQRVLNEHEVSDDFGITFGEKREKPFVSRSPVIRSAMSDGALSPEAVRAFSFGATLSRFPLNTGEGGLTSNFFYTHRPDPQNATYLEIVRGGVWAETAFKIAEKLFNRALAINLYRRIVLNKATENTYLYDPDSHLLFRIDWNAPLEAFPTEVPDDMPDLILQIGSGLYGVRDGEGNFDPDRYRKAMRFCRMTEIKIAQGAKQTGGKIAGPKVSADISYYRGVPVGKDLISPNRFPYASSHDELFDFIGRLQQLSGKPVGFKIVVSDPEAVHDLARTLKERIESGQPVPDFITVDGGDGGSATAPLELMESVGLVLHNALYLLDTILRRYGVREQIKIIGSGKILTPDDVVITLALGADAVGIARGFMMSGGCIRARQCSGTGSHECPVGLATQNPRLRASYLVVKKAGEIGHYHTNLLKGIKTMLAVMGLSSLGELNKKHLNYRTENGEIFFNIDTHFSKKFNY